MKKVIIAIVLALMVFSMAACGENSGREIPDVFGIDYTDAIAILEADGFEVNAIETSVDSFSDKLLWPLENVQKGTVFKVDDYIIDGRGRLNQNYDVVDSGKMLSDDNSIVIYYAKEDYEKEDDSQSEDIPQDSHNNDSDELGNENDVTEPPTDDSAQTPENDAENEETEGNGSNSTTIDPDFKAAMDSYENFMDEYVAFMKKYSANPTDMSLLAEYSEFMSDYADFVEDFEKWEDEDLNDAELAYYLEVQARVTKKLADMY